VCRLRWGLGGAVAHEGGCCAFSVGRRGAVSSIPTQYRSLAYIYGRTALDLASKLLYYGQVTLLRSEYRAICTHSGRTAVSYIQRTLCTYEYYTAADSVQSYYTAAKE
jgi:hypothetical protein